MSPTMPQKACFAKVLTWLQMDYPDLTPAVDVCRILLHRGSAITIVRVDPYGEQESLIWVESCVVSGADLRTDLLRFLLEQNARKTFGGFSIRRDGSIWYRAALLGSTCDRLELTIAVTSVLDAADHYDNEIVAIWGGQRAVERNKFSNWL